MAKMYITIMLNGEIKIQMEGVNGKKCIDFSKAFEETLGDVVDRKFTSEYYQEGITNRREDYLKERKWKS